MRTGFSFIVSPEGRAGTVSKLKPLSDASFSNTAKFDAFAGTYIAPGARVLPATPTGDFSQFVV